MWFSKDQWLLVVYNRKELIFFKPTAAHDHFFDPIGQAGPIIEFWYDSPEIRLDQSHALLMSKS